MVSAQLIKYAANAFLATKISFINSIAYICDKTGADIKEVSKGLGLDPRIGQSFLNAGLGYGGSCFPKDTWALISFSKRLGYDFQFLKQVDKINKNQIDYFVEKITRLLPNLAGKTITILGLSFKPDTDDLRESRSVLIIKKLLAAGAKINATDPVAIANCRKLTIFQIPIKHYREVRRWYWQRNGGNTASLILKR
jgi:UDPglucose 6-dehydrogenase